MVVTAHIIIMAEFFLERKDHMYSKTLNDVDDENIYLDFKWQNLQLMQHM